MVDKDYGASPPDSANSLWYHSKTNWFEDEDASSDKVWEYFRVI